MTDELAWPGVARLRQGLYRFFGAGLLTPTAERVEGLHAGAELLDASGIEAFAFAGPWGRLMTTMSGMPPAAELEAEYIRLFVVGTGHTPCPPFESHYVGRPQEGNSAVTIGRLERTYRDLGLSLSPDVPHTHDHAATELEVLSVLCGLEYDAWREGALAEVAQLQQRELEFLDEHVGLWFGQFAGAVAAASPPGFYADLTACARAFVHHDRELLWVVSRAGKKLEVK